jgi:hypothetical protein
MTRPRGFVIGAPFGAGCENVSDRWPTLQQLADERRCRNPLRINRWDWPDIAHSAGHVQGHLVTAWRHKL